MKKSIVSAAALLALTSVTLIGAQDITNKDLLDGLTNPSRWLTHSGDYTGARFSPLTQITPANASQLAPQWTFQTGVVNKFEATPIVIDGVMYVTGPLNHAWAIDARTGKQIWHYQRQLPTGLKVCCGMVNRGFAVYGDRLFMGTLDAHFVALEMKTGKVIYDIEMAAAKDGFAATGAPLVVNGKVIAGVAGGEFANRGFLDAYNPATGERRVALLYDSRARRAGQRFVEGRDLAARRRPDLADRHVRSAAQSAVLGHRQPEPRLGRREPARRQPLHRLAGRARSRHRQDEVALPVHAARHARLGRERDPRACRHHGQRPAAQGRDDGAIATASST